MSRAATRNARLTVADLLLVARCKENHSATLSAWLGLVKGGIGATAYLGITSSKLNPGAVDTVTLAGRGHGISARLNRVTIVYCCRSVSLN
jgi:hypothetical protein